jgi:hypothetical protein
MDPLMVVLRMLHIGFGVLWVGAAWMLFLYVQPTARALGPEVERTFSNYLLRRRRLALTILIATVVTVAAGVTMLAIDISRYGTGLWFSSGFGIGITIGAVAAIGSFILGPTLIVPMANRLEKIGTAVADAGGQPTESQAAELQAVGNRLRNVLAVDSALLLVAVVLMAIARYL